MRTSILGLAVAATLAMASSTFGALIGSSADSVGSVNLTTEGTGDWVKWSQSNGSVVTVRKAGVTPQLGSLTLVGFNQTPYDENRDPTLSWTDGDSPVSGSTTQGLRTDWSGDNQNQYGHGFSFTAPASSAERTLKVYVGGWNAQIAFTATLGGETYTETLTGAVAKTYTLTYSSETADTLNVSYVVMNGTDQPTGVMWANNASIMGATLTAVPEPTALGLLAVSGLAMLRRRRQA